MRSLCTRIYIHMHMHYASTKPNRARKAVRLNINSLLNACFFAFKTFQTKTRTYTRVHSYCALSLAVKFHRSESVYALAVAHTYKHTYTRNAHITCICLHAHIRGGIGGILRYPPYHLSVHEQAYIHIIYAYESFTIT